MLAIRHGVMEVAGAMLRTSSRGHMARSLYTFPLLQQAPGSLAIQDPEGCVTGHAQLVRDAHHASQQLARAGVQRGDRVALLISPGTDFVRALWACWRAGATAVPLCVSHPAPELAYVLQDTTPRVLFTNAALRTLGDEALRQASVSTVPLPVEEARAPEGGEGGLDEALAGESVGDDLGALIVYTSGTTGRPKGVVTTHAALRTQITDLVTAWGWCPSDRILHYLPLHHVHGLVNKLCCALWAGATVEFFRFSPHGAWRRLADDTLPQLTLFMGVPTVYAKMIEAFEERGQAEAAGAGGSGDAGYSTGAAAAGASKLRLMVSGSAPLPVSVLERWREITGHTLLERYGMTEFGMALSNPLRPVEARLPGHVGQPLPSVTVRVVDPATEREVPPGQSGELRVRGPNVFKEYLNRAEATRESFDAEGYFKTGDVAMMDPEHGSYRILGRSSVDILKVRGYKVSALDVERCLLEHPDVAEAAVVGLAHRTDGQRVAAVVRAKAGREGALGSAALRDWVKERAATYKVPAVLQLVSDIPKNAMGKVNKKQLVRRREAGADASGLEEELVL